jgi:multidrug resistance efflux pump
MSFLAEFDRDAWRALQDAEASGDFFNAWLHCLISQFEGINQAVLIWAEEANTGPFRPAAFWPEEAPASPEVAALCERAIELRLPLSQSAGVHAFAFPVMAGADLLGVVALSGTARLPDNLAVWLRWGSGWLIEHAGRAAQPVAGQAQENYILTLDLLTRILEGGSARDAAQAVVTEAAQRLGCERVSLGFGDIHGVRLFALSHSADFSRRIDLSSAIESAMDESADQGEPIRLGGEEDSATQLLMVREHRRLQRDYDAEALLSVPFKVGDAVGVFLFEWAAVPADRETFHLAEALVPIVGQALAERRRAGRPWPVRFKDGLAGEWHKLIGPRQGRRKLVAAMALAVVAFLVFAEGEFRIAAPSQLEGGVRRVIVAPFDGFVGESTYRAGQEVEEGTVLARLDDRDLRLETSRWDSQQTQYRKQAHDAQAQHNLAQLQISLAQTRQAEVQRELTESMLARSHIKAPFPGVIVAGDLSQQLGATVKKGQVLFEIAPLDFYRIILEVEEVDIQHVRVGQKGELILAALPARTFPFAVSLVTPVAVAREGRNFFRVEATLEQHDPRLRPGMEGVAKVKAGTRSQVWIWTHRFLDWARLQLWIWLGL